MLSCIKKGTVVEAALACRGIALLLVTLGAGDEAESLQEDAHPVFEQVACYGKAVAVKAAAIEALAVTAFTASNDPAVVDKCMTGFANLWKTGSAKVATAAIRGWSLLLSTVPTCRMTTHSVEESLQSLAKQLHSEDVEVRAAAGEAIALLYHSCGISDLDAFLENGQLDESPPASPVRQFQESQSQPQPHPQSQSPVSTWPLSDPQPQHQHGSLKSLTPQVQTISPQGGAVDAASSASSASTEITSPQQAYVRTEPDSASLRSADADSEPQARRLTQHSSESQAAESSHSHAHEDIRCLPQEHDAAQIKMAAQQHGHSPQHAQQHANDTSHGDNHLQHHPADAANTAEANGNLDSQQASSPLPPARNQDAAAEDISSSQQQGMVKPGRAANPRPASQNPQQKAEAISNGLDDVVGRMRELATNRGDKNRRSKKDRVSMKSTFRELCNVVEVCTSTKHIACDIKAAWRGTAQSQHSAAQNSTAQHGAAQRSTAQHSTAQHSTAQGASCRCPTTPSSTVRPNPLHYRLQSVRLLALA
ncbi:hypothetical protein ABBQ38_012337 [Trebouxia sp. C0009 RCD-2024]